MRILFLLVFFSSFFLNGQNQVIKKSYKKQILDNEIDKSKIVHYDKTTGLYTNLKYKVAFRKPKNWNYDFGAGEFSIFRTFQIDSGYTLAIIAVETDLYPKKNFSAHNLYDKTGKEKIESATMKLFEKADILEPINLNIIKVWKNDFPALKTTYDFVQKEEGFEVKMKAIGYKYIVNGTVIDLVLSVPELFFNSNQNYFYNLFIGFNVLDNNNFLDEITSKTKKKSFKYYWDDGVKKAENEDFKSAIEAFTKAIDNYPDHQATPGTYFARGIAKNKIKEFYGAINDFTTSIELGRKQGSGPSVLKTSYNSRGNSKALLGDMDGACEDWKIARSYGFNELDNLIKKYCN